MSDRGHSRHTRTATAPASASSFRRCPECAEPFKAAHPRQLFCSNEHKTAFHNRATVRGRALTPIVMAARITRDGSRGDVETGKEARREGQQMMDRWAREDREAGRLSMVDYMRERRRIGY
ncbi:hypothetical protein KNJ79_01970 [Sphingopyxis indica]|uniref:hypothetical protein n=1 Tax=Sphingopyxis indica TaxID=436663 RepID=UPI0029394752|nr:hypothetical protein [Sphingopyxis indica]WOF43754.1 hypothetical protein KNJ79_01970 [Sphingopyxis indica]